MKIFSSLTIFTCLYSLCSRMYTICTFHFTSTFRIFPDYILHNLRIFWMVKLSLCNKNYNFALTNIIRYYNDSIIIYISSSAIVCSIKTKVTNNILVHYAYICTNKTCQYIRKDPWGKLHVVSGKVRREGKEVGVGRGNLCDVTGSTTPPILPGAKVYRSSDLTPLAGFRWRPQFSRVLRK